MNLAATMSLDNRGFLNPLAAAQSGVANATNSMRATFAGLQRMLGLVGVSFAAFKSAEAFSENLKSVFGAGKELQGLSEATGTSIKDLVTLRKAFDDVGIGADSIQQNLIMMQKALGGVNEEGMPTKAIFQQIGLSIEDLKRLDTTSQLNSITGAISKLPTQAQRAAAATGIFGRAGADMLKLVAHPDAITEAGKAVGMQAAIYQRSAARFAEITNVLDSLSKRVKGFFLGFADTISPVLLPMLKKLRDAMNFTGMGQQLGAVIANFKSLFTQEKTVKLAPGVVGKVKTPGVFEDTQEGLAFAIQAGGTVGLNYLIKGFRATVAVFTELLGQAFATLLQPSFWTALWHMFSALTNGIAGMLLNAFREPIATLQAEIEALLAKIPKSLGGTDEQGDAKKEKERLDDDYLRLSGLQKAAYDKGNNSLGDALTQKMDANRKAVEWAQKTIDHPLTVDERRKRILDNGGPSTVGGMKAGDFEATAQDEATKGIAAIKAVTNSGIVALEPLKKALKDAFSGPDLIALPPEMQKKWQEIFKKLTAAIPEEVKPQDKGDQQGGGITAAGKAPSIEGDRLAKIGLFVGGGGPALDYARRTAVACESLLRRGSIMSDNSSRMPTGPLIPSWGS